MLDSVVKQIALYILPSILLIIGMRFTLGKNALFLRFIGMYFIITFIQIGSYIILMNQSYAFWPHLVHLASPFHYLVGPFSYLYIYFAVHPLAKFKPIYLLHFIPFFLHTIELMPFFVGPIDDKILEYKYVFDPTLKNKLYVLQSHLVPSKVHSIFKIAFTTAYYIVSLQLFYTYLKGINGSFVKLNNSKFLRWLMIDFVLRGLSLLFLVLIAFGFFAKQLFITYPLLFFFFGELFGNAIFFIVFPAYQNGLYFMSFQKDFLSKSEIAPAVNKMTWNEQKYEQLNVYLESEIPFIHENFTKVLLAEKLGLSDRQLSKIIFEKHQISFPEFIAEWRIKYIKTMMEVDEQWKKMPLDLMAEKSGFGTRQSLHRSVVKLYNVTPLQYFNIKP